MKNTRILLLTGTLALGLAACGKSAIPESVKAQQGSAPPPELPAPTFAQTVSQELAIPMQDGVRLAATVTFPSLDGSTPAPGRFPVVVSITPYSRNGVGGAPDRVTFATRGIIGATVDTRGTGGSEGNL